MLRKYLPVSLMLAACSRAPAPPPVAPARDGKTTVAQRPAAPASTLPSDTSIQLPPAPVLDSTLDRELVQELRLAADSAADEAVLEQLAAAGEAAPETDAALPDETAPHANGATFDIDVTRFNSHDRVQYYLDFFRKSARDRFGIWLNRMPRYEVMIRRRLQAEGLPSDLVYLALIESGFSNTATSRARAVGMWQFMTGTAKLYGLRIDRWVDERRDPYKATDAAARHLHELSERFGSYYLAAAAYNAGAGKVSRGLDRLPDDDSDSLASDATFFRLYDTNFLRRETKDYVPKLIAAAMIAKAPTQYGFPAPLPPDSLAPYDSIVVHDITGLDVIARLADTTVAAIRELNPQYLRLVTPPNSQSVVRLPLGRGALTEAAYAELPASRRVNFREHVVRSGETVRGIARSYHISEGNLLASNPRLRGRKLRSGQLVVVPTGGPVSPDIARQLAAADEMTETRFHKVKRGETLGLIASRYGVTQHQLVAWNHLGKVRKLRAGQRIRVAAGEIASRTAALNQPAGVNTKLSVAKHISAKEAARRDATSSRPQARSHLVQAGETLTGLARRYGVTVQALREANGLAQDAALRRGARIRIPA